MVEVVLGRTAVRVSRLSLGTGPLGGMFAPVEEVDALAVVRGAVDSGVRLIDTAPYYGSGLAETRVGDSLEGRSRGEFALSTKVGRLLDRDVPPDVDWTGEPFFKGAPPLGAVFDFSYDGVLRSLEQSLERLRLDSVDVVHVHDPGDFLDQAIAEACAALVRLRDEGTISAVGVGMNSAEPLVRFAREADVDCLLLAGRYTLLDQSGLDELLPLCLERGIAVIAAAVFNSGVLADPRSGATFDYGPAPASVLERARRLEQICTSHDVPLAAAALQFPLGHPAVATVLVGMRSSTELEQNLRHIELPVPPELWAEMKAEGLLPEDAPVPDHDRG